MYLVFADVIWNLSNSRVLVFLIWFVVLFLWFSSRLPFLPHHPLKSNIHLPFPLSFFLFLSSVVHFFPSDIAAISSLPHHRVSLSFFFCASVDSPWPTASSSLPVPFSLMDTVMLSSFYGGFPSYWKIQTNACWWTTDLTYSIGFLLGLPP